MKQFATTVLHWMRWAARVVGSLILAFVLLHVMSEGFPKLQNVKFQDGLLWIGFALSLVGFALIWKWELTGGIVAIAGITLFYAVHFALSGNFPGGWVFPLFFLPGALSVICWLSDRRASIG